MISFSWTVLTNLAFITDILNSGIYIVFKVAHNHIFWILSEVL